MYETMRELNIDFQETYKSVDKFIRDAYGSTEGVTEYIRTMEESYRDGFSLLGQIEWEREYKRLKDVRHKRNMLAHEASIDSDVCEEDDLDWLNDFKERLYSGKDPLAILNRAKRSQQVRKKVPDGWTKVEPTPPKDLHIRFDYDPPVPEDRNGSGAGPWIILALLLIVIIIIVIKMR